MFYTRRKVIVIAVTQLFCIPFCNTIDFKFEIKEIFVGFLKFNQICPMHQIIVKCASTNLEGRVLTQTIFHRQLDGVEIKIARRTTWVKDCYFLSGFLKVSKNHISLKHISDKSLARSDTIIEKTSQDKSL